MAIFAVVAVSRGICASTFGMMGWILASARSSEGADES